MKNAEKKKVLSQIADGRAITEAGRAKYRINGIVIHLRFCSPNSSAPAKFKFNINPNSLSADYELWICGSCDSYYLMPIALIDAIYHNPEAYIDRYHPEIRIVSVDVETDTVTYATGGQFERLGKYRQAKL